MSTESLNMTRSESVTDLNSDILSTPNTIRTRNFVKDPDASPSKPFGLGKIIIYIFFI